MLESNNLSEGTNVVKAIYGGDLIRLAKHTDIPSDLLRKIDPNGFSLVVFTMPHNDASDWRLLVLFKLLNDPSPHESTLTVEWEMYDKLVNSVKISEN